MALVAYKREKNLGQFKLSACGLYNTIFEMPDLNWLVVFDSWSARTKRMEKKHWSNE